MEQNVVEDGNCTSPPGTRTSDGQQEISGKADFVESNMSQGTIAPISKAEADGKDITKQAKEYYDKLLLQLQIFSSAHAEKHFADAEDFERKCQQLERASTGLVIGGVIVGIGTVIAGQFSKNNGGQASSNVEQTSGNIEQTSGNGKQTSGNVEQTSGNGKQSSGNGKQTSGIGKQTSGNVEQTSGNVRQTSANGEQTSGNITKFSDIGKHANVIRMKFLAGIKRNPITATVSVLGLSIFGVMQCLEDGTNTILPSFQKRAEGHRQVVFGWSGLAHKIKATRIELRKSDIQSDTMCSKYQEHIKEYQELGQVIVVRDSTLKAFLESQNRHDIEKREREYLENWPVTN